MDINLELYKVFYYVSTTLSFSEASRQLFISQSSCQPVCQNFGEKIKSDTFYPKYQEGSTDSRR